MQRYNEIGTLAKTFSERPDFYYKPLLISPKGRILAPLLLCQGRVWRCNGRGRGRFLQVRINLAPLSNGRYDIQRYQLVAHLAEVLVALVELRILLGSALRNLELGAF